jgi:hypothetical protein
VGLAIYSAPVPDRAAPTGLVTLDRGLALHTEQRSFVRVHGALVASVIVVFVISLAAFALSPNRQLTDSYYSMLLSEEIYRHHDVYLDAYFRPPLDPTKYPGITSGEYPYMIEQEWGHLFYFYPPGSSILSVPFVAVLNFYGFSPVGPNDEYDPNGELAIQGRIAAVLMAAFTACVFLMANLLTASRGWSYVIAFGTAFGTQIWSTASRVLWSHTWGVLLLGLAILYLVGGEQRRWRVNPVILATLMVWTFFVRPTNAIAYAAVSVYVVLRLRSILVGYLVTSLAWMGTLVLYSEFYFGEILPAQYRQAGGFELNVADQLWALAGLLVSPSRGVLIFSPVLLVVCLWLLRYWRWLPSRGLVLVAVSVCGLQVLLLTSWKVWWGGFAFGPRLLTDVVPWLSLLATAAVVAWRRAGLSASAGRARIRGSELVLAGVLLGLSVWIHWRGANSIATAWWNVSPVSLDVAPGRVWDWSQPQFLATQLPGP